MSVNIEFKNDITNAKEDTQGSDGRLNTSSRSDGRTYYNSRDKGQTYSMVWNFNTAASGEYAAYLKNTSTFKTLVISAVGLNAEVASRFQLETVTGTASGTDISPFNLNTSAPNDASCTAVEGASAGTGITGLTIDEKIDFAQVGALGHEEFRLNDTLRLKQNQAVAINVLETAGSDVFGVIFFYFE